MAFKDLREFIAALEGAGELLRVKEEVDWKYEVAAWARQSYDLKPRGPALLFEKIKGYPSGYRIFTNGIGSYPRLALALGRSADTPVRELIETVRKRIAFPIEPRIVSDGPVLENIWRDDQVDLYQFPVPWWTPRDGGRYIGTWHALVSKNAETGVTNLGCYRMQLIGKNRIAVGFLPFRHIGLHYVQREMRNEPLEVAAVIGAEETVMIGTLTEEAEPVDEYQVAGALRGEPLELVKCQTVNLSVPATAEIVLEGRLLPHERVPEGPFGERTGYHAGGVRMRPVFEVTAVTFRNDPIFRGQLTGKPICEGHLANSVIISATGLATFEKAGPPGVKAIYCIPDGDPTLGAVIQMKPYYVGHSRDVGRFWLASNLAKKYVVIVDEDIDPFDLSQVWWAITTRTKASRDFEVLPFGHISRSDPSAGREGEFTDYMLIDATKKLDYPYVKAYGGHWAPVCMPPEKLMELAHLKWKRAVAGEEVDARKIESITKEIEEMEKAWQKWRKESYALSEAEEKAEAPRSYPILQKE